MTGRQLRDFVRESNRIEGIHREPTLNEINATGEFLDSSVVTVGNLATFVNVCAPGASLRVHKYMDVRVGDHTPPPGGTDIGLALDDIVRRVNEGSDPFAIHIEYETLHPFTDGNGRSGRVLWAWMMERQGRNWLLKLGFLHAWYYQSLSASRTVPR